MSQYRAKGLREGRGSRVPEKWKGILFAVSLRNSPKIQRGKVSRPCLGKMVMLLFQ